MGRFFKSDKKQSGYGQAADKRATSGKFSDFPTKIAKKIDTLQTKIDTIIDTHKAVGKSLPISKKNLIKTLKNKIQGLIIGDKKEFQKKATKQNLQTTANNPRLKAQMDEMNKEANKIKKLVEEGVITKGEARAKAKTLPRKKGGQLRGMGVALRGGGKVMRG
jgi:hypothetical protein